MKPEKPTEKQINMAQQIADKLNRSIPGPALVSELTLRMWVNSVKGRLSESEIKEIVPPKRYEFLLNAIEWYQRQSHFERITCPVDAAALVGVEFRGHINLRCPVCGCQSPVPSQIEKRYMEARHAHTTE